MYSVQPVIERSLVTSAVTAVTTPVPANFYVLNLNSTNEMSKQINSSSYVRISREMSEVNFNIIIFIL